MFLHGAGSQEDHPHLHEKLNFHESNCTHTLLHPYLDICYSVCKFSDFVKKINVQLQTISGQGLASAACYSLPLEAQGVHDPAKVSRCQGAKVKRAKVSKILQDTLLGTNWWPTSKAPICVH